MVDVSNMAISQAFSCVLWIMVLLSLHTFVYTQQELETFIDGNSGTLLCAIGGAQQPSWQDVNNGISIFTIFNGKVIKTDKANQSSKYDFYTVEYTPGSQFDLVINPVQLTDIASLNCLDVIGGGTIEQYQVEVEVPTDHVNISCGSCTGAEEPTCDCTCIAEGGYPATLSLQWNISTGNIISQELNPPGEPDSDKKYDFRSAASVSMSADDAVLSCSVQGYVNQAVIETFPGVASRKTLSSPECELILTKSPSDECTVILECSCQGYPSVNTCTFFTRNGTKDAVIPDNSDSCVIDYSVSPGNEVNFLCLGSNGINFTQGFSSEKFSSCPKSTTTSPTTPTTPTTETTTVTPPIDTTTNSTADYAPSSESPATTEQGDNGPDGDGGASSAAIVGGVVGGCVVVGGGVIIIILIVKKSGNGEGGNNKAQDFDPPGEAMNNTVTASTFETTNSAPPVYGVVNKSTKKKSDNTDGNGVNSKLQSEPDQVEYAAVNKPKPDPQPAPRSSKPPGNNTEPEKVELQYADIDHSNRGRSNEIRQPADEPTEYATVQSVIV